MVLISIDQVFSSKLDTLWQFDNFGKKKAGMKRNTAIATVLSIHL